MRYMARVFASIRSRGLGATFVLVIVKLKAIFELFVPRMIWGERVGLRSVKSSLTTAEIEQVYQWSRDEEVLRLSGTSPSPLTLNEFYDQLRYERWRPETDQRNFYIVTRENQLVGQIRLYSIDWKKSEGELGIFLDKEYWGKQYGRDAIKLFVNYIFTSTPIKRIHLGTFKDNLRAQRSFAASGFRIVGYVTRFLPSRGDLVDGVEMELVRDDFR